MASPEPRAGPSRTAPGDERTRGGLAGPASQTSPSPRRKRPHNEQEAAEEASLAMAEGERARIEAEAARDFDDLNAEAMPSDSKLAQSSQDDGLASAAPQPQHGLEAAMALINQGRELEAIQVPLRLSAIRIEGAKTMRPSFLQRMCRPYIDVTVQDNFVNRMLYSHRLDHVMPGQPTNLSALLALLQSVGSDVASLDVFNDINASLAPSSNSISGEAAASAKSLASVEDVDVVLACRERPRFFAKTSTDVGNGEGNATIQAQVRNVFGGAETADVAATTGTRTRRAYNASLSWPLFGFADHTASVSAFAQDRDLTHFASATEGIKGLRAALRLRNANTLGAHEIAYDLAHRHLGRLQPTASLSMRRLAGHSVKSSIVHSYTRDTRDDPFLASRGSLLKVLQEYAGLGGDANHYRIETEAQFSRRFYGPGDGRSSAAEMERSEPFRGGYGFALAARSGLLASLNGRAPAFSDRFQLGGPTCVRMFRYNSLGPKDGLDSLGGDAFYSVGASLFAPLWPGKAHWPLKLHTFVNAGQLIQLQQTTEGKGADSSSSVWQQNAGIIADELMCKPSASAGVGILFRQGSLRAELNVGVPLAVRRGDGSRTGVQLGVGLSFL